MDAIVSFLLEIPQAVGLIAKWLVEPINTQYLNISPLGLFGVAGVGVIITLIGIHVVRLFL